MIRKLLEESLVLWGVSGEVADSGEGIVLSAAGRAIRVAPGSTSRWVVHAEGGRERPCASVTGVLSEVRNLLEVECALQLRIATVPSKA